MVRAEPDTEDESGEEVALTFGDLPDGVAKGTVAQTVLTLEDLVLVSFGSATYTATEGDGDAVVTVHLSDAAASEVTVPITAEGAAGATAQDWSGVPDTVTFPVGETSTTFTVVAFDDMIEDYGEMVRLGFGTLPTGYGEGSPGSATITLMNDDDRGIVLSKSSLSIDEGDTTRVSYTVKLATQPSTEVTVTVSGHAGTDVSLDETALTFTTGNWSTAQTVTVTAARDSDSTDDSVTLTHAAAGGEYDGTTATLGVTVTDNDGGIVLSESSLTVDEGDTAGVSYTVTLASQPTTEVTVTVSGHAGTDVSLGGLSVTNTLTFTTGNWDTAQTVTVTAIQDADGSDDDVTLTHTASGGEYDGVSAELQITVADTTPISVSFGSDEYSVDEGGEAAEVVIELSEAPAAQVVIPLMATGHDGATEDDWSGVPDSVTFAAGETSQSFMVTAVDDDVEDNGEMVELAFGALPDGVVVGTTSTARVTLMNDDQPQSTPTAPELRRSVQVRRGRYRRYRATWESGCRIRDMFIGGHTPHLQVGHTLEGYMEPCRGDMGYPGDVDMFKIELEEGKYYRVEMRGSASGDGTLRLTRSWRLLHSRRVLSKLPMQAATQSQR